MIYLEARQVFIHELTRDAEAHEAGRYQDIGAGFDQVDAELPRDEGPEFDKLFIALAFWDGWIDARNHDWQYYKGIKQSDWPRLARTVIKDLQADQEITDPLVLSHFNFRNRGHSPGLIRRLLDKISGNMKS